MRNGDLYKMRSLLEHGTSIEDIIHRWRWEYSEDEIRSFIQLKPKRGRPKKVDDVGSSDM